MKTIQSFVTLKSVMDCDIRLVKYCDDKILQIIYKKQTKKSFI